MKRVLLLTVVVLLPIGLDAITVRLYNGSKIPVQFICGPAGSDGSQSRWAVVEAGHVTTPNSTTLATTDLEGNPVYLNQDITDNGNGALDTRDSSNYPPAACLVRRVDNHAEVLTNVTPLVWDSEGNASLAFYGTDMYGTNSDNHLYTYLGLTGWCGGGNC